MCELRPDCEVRSCEQALPAMSELGVRFPWRRASVPQPGSAGEGLRHGHPGAAFTAVTGDFVRFVLGTWMSPFGKVSGCLCCFAVLKSRVSISVRHQTTVGLFIIIFKKKNKTFSLCKNWCAVVWNRHNQIVLGSPPGAKAYV